MRWRTLAAAVLLGLLAWGLAVGAALSQYQYEHEHTPFHRGDE